jgi:hypothetical protein
VEAKQPEDLSIKREAPSVVATASAPESSITGGKQGIVFEDEGFGGNQNLQGASGKIQYEDEGICNNIKI